MAKSGHKSARDLGVILDSYLQLDKHIKNVCLAASFGVYNIGKLCNYMYMYDVKSTEPLVHAFSTSHLDYCNSLIVCLAS